MNHRGPVLRAVVGVACFAGVMVSMAGCTDATDAGVLSNSSAGSTGSAGSATTWSKEVPSLDQVRFAAAAASSEVAVAFIESTEENDQIRDRVLVQRLSDDGVPIDSEVELGSTLLDASDGEVAIASDGEGYVVCWSFAEQIECTQLASPSAAPVSVFSGIGRAPSVAHAGSTWLIAYHETAGNTVPTGVIAQTLSEAFAPETSRRFRPYTGIQVTAPLLTAAEASFVLVVSDDATGDSLEVVRLDTDLRPVNPPLPLQQPFWALGAVAATSDRVIVSLSEPYGSRLHLAEGQQIQSSTMLDGGGKSGLFAALAANRDTLFSAWVKEDSTLHVQAFQSGTEKVTGLKAHPSLEGGVPLALIARPTHLLTIQASSRTLIRASRLPLP